MYQQTTLVTAAEARAAATTSVSHADRETVEVREAGSVRGAAVILSSSIRKSPAACQRFFGFFSRHRVISSPSRGFNPAGSALRSGSRARIDAITSGAVSPENG